MANKDSARKDAGRKDVGPFDPVNLDTYRLDLLKEVPLIDLINALNDLPVHTEFAGQKTQADARGIILKAIALGFATMRHRHDTHTLMRTPMFAMEDGASWARPTIGLKRTFPPGLHTTVYEGHRRSEGGPE
ncbi:small capsid protein [Falconid herpesvirus 1]|uniref:Small capsomere-interacting protein n=2 Tax=Columbid alphaherpesvirus 1 TaxID=93386 RepID=A0A068EVY6_9ALPH|nr:small capsid protein [Falconid herpesvirus 1]YP_009352943.1 small capsid protein [Columbid alphaherpesvirus 1]AID52739.1 small capsid protein [Falconid herpesvirus 1]ARD71360.1 small capsid protein [Columbid alphaherpesvirus 1]